MSEARAVRRLSTRLTAITGFVLVVALAVVAWESSRSFETSLLPRLALKAETLASVIRAQVVRAVEAGVPLPDLVGVESFLAETLIGHPEVELVRLYDAQDRVLFTYRADASETAPTNLTFVRETMFVGDRVIGAVELGVSPDYLQEQLFELHSDLAIILLVSVVLAFELLMVMIAITISGPLRRLNALLARSAEGDFSYKLAAGGSDELGRLVAALNGFVDRQHARYETLAQRLRTAGKAVPEDVERFVATIGDRLGPAGRGKGAAALEIRDSSDVRMPLFLFFFATELPRSFLPLYARDLYAPVPGLSYEAAIALPIAAYLALVALLTPVAGMAIGRFGVRRLFLLGLVPTALGLAMSAQAVDVLELTLWRCLNAAGFALCTISALDYIAQTSSKQGRTRGMAVYTAAFVTAGLCGSAIGGILADRLGFGPTFLIATGLSLFAALLVFGSFRDAVARAPDQFGAGRKSWPKISELFHAVSPRLGLLMVIAAIPTQLLTTGFVFYATPMLLDAAGYGPAVIGRVLMIYFLVIILLNGPAARLADRLNLHALLTAFSLLLSATAATIPWLTGGTEGHVWAVAVAIGLVGLAHAVGLPSKGALLLREAEAVGGERQTLAISIYRLVERIGSVSGPLLAAWLGGLFGFASAILIMGLYVGISGVVLLAVALFAWRIDVTREGAAS